MNAIHSKFHYMTTGTRRRVVVWSALVAVCAVLSASFAARVLAQNTPAPAAVTAPVLASTMAHSCAACHGTNGQLGDESFAPLAGMPAGQFVKTMTDFREGRRPATLMGHVAQGFSDKDFEAMADFFAAHPPLNNEVGVAK
jgi:sulfide dehydrogenase cytochrome subunit